MNIYEIIDMLRARPEMYIGKRSISALHAFLSGWQACEQFNHTAPENKLFPLDFWFMNEFAAHYYGDDFSPNAGWAHIILEHCGGDEAAALDKFFKLYDEFCASRIELCKKAVLTDENRRYNEDFGAYKVDENGIRTTQLYPGAQRLYHLIFSGKLGGVLIIEYSGKRRVIKAPFGGIKQFVEDNFGENVVWEKLSAEESGISWLDGKKNWE